jgi:hypothetical protein
MDHNQTDSLFDQFQGGREAPASTSRRPLRAFHSPRLLHHGVAQCPELHIANPLQPHPKLKDRKRHQLCGFVVGIGQQYRPAFLQRRKNRPGASYKIGRSRFLRHRACEVRPRRSSRLFHLSSPRHRKSRNAIGFVVARRPCVGVQSVAQIRDLAIAMEQAWRGEIFSPRGVVHDDRDVRSVDQCAGVYDRGQDLSPN